MNQLLRTELKRESDGSVLLTMYWEDTDAKSKWTMSVTLTDEQLDDLRVRISSFQQKR